MKAWLQQNWKLLAAAVGVFVLVILLYLWQRNRSSGAASTISFPGNPTSAGADTGAAAAVATAVQQAFTGHTGPAPPGFNPLLTIPYFSDPNNPSSQIGWVPTDTDITITGPPVQGRAQAAFPGGPSGSIWYPVSWGGQTGWLNQLVFESYKGTPFGQGGPGPQEIAGNLQQAAVAAQRRGHLAGLQSGRQARRWQHDATQAMRESRRIFSEARGAAPVRSRT